MQKLNIYTHRNCFLRTKREKEATNHNTAADAAADLVTSLLAVTNEPVHIVLALEMSRGVKMSPQIAFGHQMSPLHSLSSSAALGLFPSFLFSSLFSLLSLPVSHWIRLFSIYLPSHRFTRLFVFSSSQKGNLKVSLLASHKPFLF